MKMLFFEDLKIGDHWESRARTVTESDIVNFACITGDFDPLHVDHEFAKQGPFRKPIAHGLLGISLVAGLGSNFPAVNTLAFIAVRGWAFLRPIYVGETVHVVNEVESLQPKGRRGGQVIWKRQLLNHAGEVLQSGQFETLVARRPTKGPGGDAAGSGRGSSPPKRDKRKSKSSGGD